MNEYRTFDFRRIIAVMLAFVLSFSAFSGALEGRYGAAAESGTDTAADAVTPTDLLAAAAAPSEDGHQSLQEMINDEIRNSNLFDRIIITLKKSVTYTSNVEIVKDASKTYGDDFGVEITTEDAGDDGLQAGGTTKMTGTLLVKGINVAIRGLAVTGKITVNEAELDYSGTKGADAVDITMDSKSKVNVNTGAGDDRITLTDNGGEANIAAGAGDDTVTAQLNGGTMTIAGEAGNDTFTVTADAGKLTADGGNGDNTVTVTTAGNTAATVMTAEGSDTVKLVAAATEAAKIDTGEGADSVTLDVKPGAGNITVETGDGDDTVSVSKTGDAISAAPSTTVKIYTGDGQNETQIDMSASDSVKEIHVYGGADSDRLHFTGTLKAPDDSNPSSVTGTKEELKLTGSNNNTLTVITSMVDSVTDRLKNKRTVKLTPAADGNITYTADQDFTNYIIDSTSAHIGKNITVNPAAGKQLLMSGVIIANESTAESYHGVWIGKDTTVDARGLQLLIAGRMITVYGTLKADLVEIEATDGTDAYRLNIGDVYNDNNQILQKTIPVPGVSEAMSGILAGAEMAMEQVNIENEASVRIVEGANIYSAGDVNIRAKVTQKGGIIKLLENLNIVNVKLGNASVDVAGGIYAGYDFAKEQTGSGTGSVKIEATNDTVMGYDASGKVTSAFPLGVSVAVLDSSVKVRDTATVEAAKDVSLSSAGSLKVATRADSGMAGLPAALAVAVLLNDVKTEVEGTVHAAKGDVKVLARGDTDASTYAEKGSGQTMLSGGYVAVTVALQDVDAAIRNGASVTAGRDVTVKAAANEKVDNRGAAGKAAGKTPAPTPTPGQGPIQDDKMTRWTNNAIGVVTGKVVPAVIEKIKDPTAQEKLAEAMKKVASGNHSVRLDENAQEFGSVTMNTENKGDQVSVSVNVKPYAGYKVKSISIRGYNPGESAWTVETKNGTNSASFGMAKKNAVVFVEYEDDDSGYTDTTDLFAEDPEDDGDWNLDTLFDELGNGADDSEAGGSASGDGTFSLKLPAGDDGAVLTYRTDAGGKCLEKVAAGDVIRLIPNPASGKALKQGGLKVSYSVDEDADTVRMKIDVVNPDDKGRYFFTVPANMSAKSEITVAAEFTDAASENAEADTTQTQIVGSAGVVVAINNNEALIGEGAAVDAGGKVSVSAADKTTVSNVADGTAISKKEAEGAGKPDENAIKRQATTLYVGYDVDGREYAISLERTENGKVTPIRSANLNYSYTFTAEPDEGYQVAEAILVYYKNKTRQTKTLKASENYAFNLTELNADKGTLAQVFFTFAKQGTYGKLVHSYDAQALIPNAIQISHTALKKDGVNEVDPDNKTGNIRFDKFDPDTNEYIFIAEPEISQGYTLDGKLKAIWIDAAGIRHEQELRLDKTDKNWHLNTEAIPAGVTVLVYAAFKMDLHSFTTGTVQNGEIKLYDQQVKRADTPKITVKPNAGYSLEDITVTYNGESTLTLKGGKVTAVAGKENLYIFTVPALLEGSKVTVTATFRQKTIGLYTGADKDNPDITLSEYTVAPGDKVTVSPNEEKVKAGIKVSKIVVTDATGKTVAEVSGNTFTVPADTAADAKLTIAATLGDKAIELKKTAPENGTMTPAVARADLGEKVTVKVEPANGFRIKTGSLKAVLKMKDGSYAEEIYLNRTDDTTYTFTVPLSDKDPAAMELTFTGEFIPGQSDNTAVKVSVGAAAAVTVALGENRAEIKGNVTAGGKIGLTATLGGSVKTESKAGYSKGNIGIGGAVSVQIASLDSKALIHKTADVKLDGQLALTTKSDVAFDVNADASGSKEAAEVGVGAGIAVAVNGADAFAAVQDGTKLNSRTEGKLIRGISITAGQKVTDSVKAKAGASGGTAGVPVAAVDVTSAAAEAYMGKVADGMLKLDGKSGAAALSVTLKAVHTVSADASAAGKSAGLGAAVAVDVISDSAKATLNQSADAFQVTLAAVNESQVNGTATASASGGKAKAGKTPDRQADSLLNTAAKMAEKNPSSGVSADKTSAAVKGRQKAETAEGSVAAAGAFAVNVQSSDAYAVIPDKINVRAADLISVTTKNATIARIKANASTTNSDIGVGIGAAVSIITLNNIAEIGDGEIQAAMLKVSATTKETDPVTVINRGNKVRTMDELSIQLGELLQGFISDLLKEIGMGDYVSDEIVGEITQEVVSAVLNDVIKETGLMELLGTGDLNSKLTKALEQLKNAESGLESLPEKLAAPFLDALNDVLDLSALSGAEMDKLIDDLVSEFGTQMMNSLEAGGKAVLTGVMDGMIDYLSKNFYDLITGFYNGKKGEVIGKLLKQAGTELGKAARKELKNFIVNTFKNTLKSVSIPGLNTQNMNRVVSAFDTAKDAYQQDSMDAILTAVTDYITSVFKKNVFDYEKMLTTLAEGDMSKKIGEIVRSAAKAASVALTNTAIDKLTDLANVKLDPVEEKPTGHVFDTQAIAGAGTKTVGAAGSVAVTVLNAVSRAIVADSAGALTVTGKVTIEANEKRKMTNTASAALDAKGNANANKTAAGSKDVTGGNEAGRKVSAAHVSMETTAGATLSIRAGDQADDKPIIHVEVQEGYKLPEKVEYRFKNKEGTEISGTIGMTQADDGTWTVNPKSGNLAVLEDSVDVTLMLKPEEILHSIPEPDTSLSGVDVEQGAVTVNVKDREKKDGKLSARVGETVEITIAKKAGRKVDAIGYSYKDAEGNLHDVVLNPSANTGDDKEKVLTLKSSNEESYIYTFAMPDADIDDILVSFLEGEEDDAGMSATTAVDAAGLTVGVGAAFSMIYGDSGVTAQIGSRKSLSTGELNVTALSDHWEDIAGAAGSDPLEGQVDPEKNKDFSLDASAALNILDNTVRAVVNTFATVSGGDLTVTATENAKTMTHATAFSIGSRTAIGATAAVNISGSAVDALLTYGATVSGDATVSAESHSEDTTRAMATAMGADIGRALAKVGETADELDKKADKVLDGSYIDNIGKGGDKSATTDTNQKISDKMNSKKASDGSDANGMTNVSTNALRSQGAKTASESAGNIGTQTAEDQIKGQTGEQVSAAKADTETKFQVAAAVGVTVDDHAAHALIGGNLVAGGSITTTATNTGNFNTMGTGAAMSLAKHANSIAAGVAVSVNQNAAGVDVKGDLVAGAGKDVQVVSTLTQNMDNDFAGKLAAQALSGSVAGESSQISLAGAVSVVVSNASSTVSIAGGSAAGVRRIEGGNVTVEATDKSKLGARAGGISFSKGSSVGMGIGSATVVSNNTVTAMIGDDTEIKAGSFTLNAEKKAVTQEDYKNLIDLRYLVTDSSNLTDAQRKNAKTGIIDVHKGDDDKNYTLDVNLSSEKLLDAVDGLNFLSAQNTYVEAVAGSVNFGGAMGESKATIAGSVAVAVANNTVSALLGKNARVTLTKADDFTGDMTVNASNGTTSRIIAGSLSAGSAEASVGVTVAVLVDTDAVKAETGDNLAVNAGGSFSQKAETSGDIQVFTGAISVAAGSSAKEAIGGAVNVIVTRNTAENTVGNNAGITSGGDTEISSSTKLDLMAISGSANVAAGANASFAAGGTVNVIVDNSKSLTAIGKNLAVSAGNNVSITSDVSDQMISGTASASVAASMNGKSGAGVVNVLVSNSAAKTVLDETAGTITGKGDMNITANNDAWMLNAGLALSGSGDAALGAAFNINVLNREATVNMNNGTLEAGGSLKTQAGGRDTSILAGLAASGSVKGATLSGTAIVLVESNTIETNIASGVKATAGKNAQFESYYSDYTIGIGGNIAVTGGSGAFGASVLTVVKNNKVRTRMGSSTVKANTAGTETGKNLNGEDVNGIYIGANAAETQFMGVAGIAAARGAAINGEVAVLVNNNTVLADAEATVLDASMNGGSVTVAAKDDTRQLLLAGGLNLSGSSAIGAAVVTVVSNKDVQAKAHDMHAAQDVSVSAKNRDDITTLAVNVGLTAGGAAIQIGVDVQVLKSKARATVGSDVTVREGDFSLNAENNTRLINVAAGVAGSLGGVAFTPVAAVTYFQGEADATLKSGSTLSVNKGNISITASSDKDVNLDTVGISVSTGAGLSGAANVLVSKDKTHAGAMDGTKISAPNGSLDIQATGDYRLRAISGAVAGGEVGIGVNAVVSVLKSSTVAELGGDSTIGRDVNVKASGNRDVINVAAALAAGQVGGGITVMVLVAGTKMSQDAADMIAYGNADSRDTKAGFDAARFMESAAAAGVDMKAINADEADEGRMLNGDILEEDLEGNGRRESKLQVGRRVTKADGKEEATFDGASGYYSDEINDEEYDGDNRGENLEAKDTTDVENAKAMNTYVYEDVPDDAVIARTLNGATITADTVTVAAIQAVAADLIGAAVGVGEVGGGISTVVAILRSNVSASSMAAIRNASGGVTVSASSVNGRLTDDYTAKDRNDAVADLLSNKPVKSDASAKEKADAENEKKSTLERLKDKLGSRSIRAFSVAAGAGAVGLGVAVSVVLTDNVTQAILGGSVTNAGDISVTAEHDYHTVMAGTGSLAVGGVAAGASVSVAQANGDVKALIEKDAVVTTRKGKNILIGSRSDVGVDALAATAGVGGVAVNAGVALSFNRLKQETGIGEGAKVTSGQDITIGAISGTTADSYLLGVSIAGIAISLNAAVSDVSADINTYIGGSNSETAVTAAGDIRMSSDVTSSAVPQALSVAVGGVAVGGNVLLAFNNTQERTAIENAAVEAVNLSVISDLAGNADSSLLAAVVGGVAVGLSVNYADMRAENRAAVIDSQVTLTGDMTVRTGSKDTSVTSASADTLSANMGVITVGLNAAVARNNTKNYAIVSGQKAVSVGGNMTVHGAGTASTNAKLTGLSLSGLNVAASAVVSLNDADSRTTVVLPGLTVGGLATFDAGMNASTDANAFTGGGSLIDVKVTAAVAYGRAQSIVDVELKGENSLGGISSTNKAGDALSATVSNCTFTGIAADGRFSGAYAQDFFSSKIVLNGARSEVGSQGVKVLTDYDLKTLAEVTPSTSGVSASLADLAANVAIAKSTAVAGADFETIKGKAHVAGDVTVLTTGTSAAEANIYTAELSVKGATIGSNTAKADNSTTQATVLRVGGTLNIDGKADVQSLTGGSYAKAVLGSSGGDEKLDLDVSLLKLDVSYAIANENMASSATVLGGAIGTAYEDEWLDEGSYKTRTVGRFDYDFKSDGKYTCRDDDGKVLKEKTTIITYDTGETVTLNANGEQISSTLEEKYDGQRKEVSRSSRNGEMVRFGLHYEWITEEETYWEPKLTNHQIEVDIYNPDENVLTAASLNIASMVKNGSKTGATASTRGPLEINIMTGGALDSEAYSTDSFAVVFEGMTATISGAATLKAETNSEAYAEGATPGKWTVVDASATDVLAGVGKRDDRQTVAVVIGKGNTLIADSIDITANNFGTATGWLDQGTNFALAEVKISTQPTESWYNTLISVGAGAALEAMNGNLTIATNDMPAAISKVNTTNYSLTLNYANMMGRNTIDQENNIDIGNNATVTANGDISITALQSTAATAETTMNGGSFIDCSTGSARNTINRVARVNIGSNATVKTTGSNRSMLIRTLSGEGDNILTKVYVGDAGLVALGEARAYTTLSAYSEINIGQGTKITGTGPIMIDARATSYNTANDNQAGIITRAEADAAALGVDPDTVAKNVLRFNTYVNINQDDSQGAGSTTRTKTEITSTGGGLLINASNDKLSAYASARSTGAGLGVCNANGWNDATLTNAIWIDDANMSAQKVFIYAENGGMLKNADDNDRAHFISKSYVKLSGAGDVVAVSRITGTMINQIRTSSEKGVTMKATDGKVIHKTTVPQDAIWQEAITGSEVTKVLGIPLASTTKKKVLEWYYFNRCDFCHEGTEYDVSRTDQESLDKRYEDAFEKALSPVYDIQRQISNITRITRARYGDEDNKTSGQIYVLDIRQLLLKDVILSQDQILKYGMWTNTETSLDVFLMPNATRLYTSASNQLQYVADMFTGDIFFDGRKLDLGILTALTANAFANPILPVGSTGSLDLRTGVLTLPDLADFELYLDEISGAWLRDAMRTGFIRTLIADQDAVNAAALNEGHLPQGVIVEELTDGGEEDGLKKYWIGATPETAEDPDQVLVYLLIDDETDEVKAFRTSVNMLAAGEAPVNVSMYLYRDSKSDRMGIEKYNTMFFDTPLNERSIVKAVTNVMEGRTLEMPKPMTIVLRGRYLEGADLPVYVLSSHAFILCDGTDGEVRTLGGYYQATFDGDTFESSYTKIEGIRDRKLTVTIKEGQETWLEWTGVTTAQDFNGNQYELANDEWTSAQK